MDDMVTQGDSSFQLQIVAAALGYDVDDVGTASGETAIIMSESFEEGEQPALTASASQSYTVIKHEEDVQGEALEEPVVMAFSSTEDLSESVTFSALFPHGKLARSGSMFVRISDEEVDRERMEEYDRQLQVEDAEEEEEKNGAIPEVALSSEPNEIGMKKSAMIAALTVEASAAVSQLQDQTGAAAFAPKTISTWAPIPTPMLTVTPITVTTTQISPATSSRNNNPQSLKNIAKQSVAVVSPKSRSTGRQGNKHVPPSVQVQDRRLAPLKEKSPYACKIIELPPEKRSKEAKEKIYLCPRDAKIMESQLQGREFEKEKQLQQPLPATAPNTVANFLFVEPLAVATAITADTKNLASTSAAAHYASATVRSNTFEDFLEEAIPLKMWPKFTQRDAESSCNLDEAAETVETSTSTDAIDAVPATAMANVNNSTATTAPTPSNELKAKLLASLADQVERGLFTASETCNVLLHTVFKDSVGDPNAVERVLECGSFQAFLHASNELQALESSALVFSNLTQGIEEYVGAIRNAGLDFPANTNFQKSSGCVQSLLATGKKSTFAVLQSKHSMKEESKMSFLPAPPPPFLLSLYLNPTNGEISQAISCQGNIYRTRFGTSALTEQVHSLLSSSRESLGLSSLAKPSNLLQTVVLCSAQAVRKLTNANLAISKVNKGLYRYVRHATRNKEKYANLPIKSGKLDAVKRKLQMINVFSGVMFQLCAELKGAGECIQSGLWSSLYVQDVLRFPRISGTKGTPPTVTASATAGGAGAANRLVIHEAVGCLAEGIRGLDYTIRSGQLALETLRFGVKLGKEEKRMIRELLEGIRVLGSGGGGDLDYGSLLMTLLCSTELLKGSGSSMDSINYSSSPSVDKYMRAAILTHLGKINWGTGELMGMARRMEEEARLLAMRSFFKLREVRCRYRVLHGERFERTMRDDKC